VRVRPEMTVETLHQTAANAIRRRFEVRGG
jgi:hypothetical protein